jgi:GR25 family glycosyltransferase involved in LPS biosynthesis
MSVFNCIIDVEDYKHYRGWNYIVEQLNANLTFNSNGVVLDTFADDCLWKKDKSHLAEDWIGIVHSAAVDLSTVDGSIDEFLNHEWFLGSRRNCRGLITLCEHTANYLKTKIDLPISVVYHPKDTDRTFDIEKYFVNPTLRHTGIHARNFSLFAKLNTSVSKIINIDGARPYLFKSLNRCFDSNNVTVQERETVKIHTDYRVDDDYINGLCESIGFVHFYDVAASNAVLEHIMTHTPLIVNKHPAIVEYLGEEYPMYYEDVCDDLDSHLSSRDFISSASNYLKERSSLSMFKIENFISFFESYKLEDKPQNTIPVYCINLKRALERRGYIENEWVNKRGIEINFFDAYDRSDYTEADLPSPYRENLSKLTTEEKNKVWEGRIGTWIPSLGEICCSISHCELLSKLIESNIPEVIILEDDAAPLFDTAEEFFDYINLCKNEEQSPNILLLHKPEDWAERDWIHIKQELEFCLILSKPTPCTQAIYYTRQGMIDAYEAASKLKGPVDYCTAFGIAQKGSFGIVKKPLVHHPITTTYIGGSRELVTDEDFTREIDADFDSAFYYKAYTDLVNYYIERADLSLEQRLFHHYRTAGRAEGRQKNKRTDLTIVTALLAGDTNIHKTVTSLLPLLTNNELK